MLIRISILFALLAAIIAAPILLRPTDIRQFPADAEILVIVTPHDQSIRRAFEEAFTEHMQQQGRTIRIDWRLPGGTSEITRLINAEFASANKRGQSGIGIDVFFGGGSHDFNRQADKGHLTPSRIFTDQPELFQPGFIPSSFSGEIYYHHSGMWIGTCLSSFGIVYNTDSLARLGINSPPQKWEDLADPRYFGQIALADPTKSGSVNKAFEMLIQEQIQTRLATIPPDAIDPRRARQSAISEGWENGLQLIQRISANARYFTDSSTKIPLDVAQGNAAAGMCIDFYGRTYNELHRQSDGSSRVQFITPHMGSSISADPIAIFRGAPNHALAESFVAFTLSKEGQRLWNFRANTPGGPRLTSLRRLPIRKDLYVDDELQFFADPNALPYQQADSFVYRGELTGHAFNALAVIIRAMCLDSHKEQRKAWQILIEKNFPAAASRAFFDISEAGYERSMRGITPILRSDNPLDAARLARNLVNNFRKNYLLAADLAGSSD